jgi:hypothetical protein
VLVIALWVRSYWTLDLVSRVTSTGQISSLGSNKGTVYFVRTLPMPTRGYGGRGSYRTQLMEVEQRLRRVLAPVWRGLTFYCLWCLNRPA